MEKRFILIVFLASSLLVQAPPNWCCVQARALAGTTKAVVGSKARCCSREGGQCAKPTKSPCLPCKQCCCEERSDDRLPPPPKKVQKSLALPFKLAVLDSWHVLAPVRLTSSVEATSPCSRLHVFHCVWLC